VNKKKIDHIIQQALTGEATFDELDYLEQWINLSEANRQTYDILIKIWIERSTDLKMINFEEMSDKIWERGVSKSAQKQDLGHFSFRAMLKIAAMLVFLASIYFIFSQNEPIVPQVMVEKINPSGQKSKVMLPDGTSVWLNSESSLKYAESFSDTERLVVLEGEAFFEVMKDENRPFIVQSGRLNTTALGTSFNISAFPEEGVIQVGLISGRIKVNNFNEKTRTDIILEAGSGIEYVKNTDDFNHFTVEQEKIIAWKEGSLVFEGDSFEGVIRKLKRWYGVNIEVQGSPPMDWKLNGTFKKENLRNVLEHIRFGRDFTYSLNGKQLTLNF
jgi:ferric-dicitrate binding protein FerR (iron transport regulator)